MPRERERDREQWSVRVRGFAETGIVANSTRAKSERVLTVAYEKEVYSTISFFFCENRSPVFERNQSNFK